MLSTVTASRKDYLKEKESAYLRNRLQNLTMGDEQAGPSGFQNKTSFISHLKRRFNQVGSNNLSTSFSRSEKENEEKCPSGFEVLTMNSDFITGFKTGCDNISRFQADYELPPYINDSGTCAEMPYYDSQKLDKKVYRCTMIKRRRLRTHPYDNNSLTTKHSAITNTDSSNSSCNSSYYRLRTTSLSSGSKKKPSSAEKCPPGNGSSGLNRSRSMENLSANGNNSEFISDNVPSSNKGLNVKPFILSFDSSQPHCVNNDTKPRDVESVSRGIQELRMEDCT